VSSRQQADIAAGVNPRKSGSPYYLHNGYAMDGATGRFTDLSFTVYETMMNRYGNMYW
jgi:hypothetical protein